MPRIERDAARFTVACGGYSIECVPDGLPLIYDEQKKNAELVEEFEIHKSNLCNFTVRREADSWPFLVVSQSFDPAGCGFEPGVLLVPETDLLFVGAGERLLAYGLRPTKRLWEDHADTGFLAWRQYKDTVLLAAELEFAAWSADGKKLWTTFVEPPWDYEIVDGLVMLDVMGNKSTFELRQGP